MWKFQWEILENFDNSFSSIKYTVFFLDNLVSLWAIDVTDHMLALCEVIKYADGFLPHVDQKEIISN